ncbi:MAG: metal-dependent transcriptional regulator [Anaerolineae bacterium]|nr:metal-dependent transcriptional regulator [Anaerolineae bacterium]
MEPTQTVEDYVRAIYQLQEGAEDVSTSALAEVMKVAPATVTSMLKKLDQLGYAVYTPYQGVSLTESGRRLALNIVRRHRLVELYLVQALEIPWDRVHEEAHRWEHVISDEVLAKMDEVLGHPERDPHGAPIPGENGSLPATSTVRLSALRSGQRAVVAEVADNVPEMLRYIGNLGLYPDVAIEIIAVAPFDGLVTVRVGERQHIIGQRIARSIFVKDIISTEE